MKTRFTSIASRARLGLIVAACLASGVTAQAQQTSSQTGQSTAISPEDRALAGACTICFLRRPPSAALPLRRSRSRRSKNSRSDCTGLSELLRQTEPGSPLA